jgi:hypothetical protein
MPNKKINQLDVRVSVATDLMLVGDPTTGTSYKSTVLTLPLVPYTGATGAVNLGAYDLTVNSLTVGSGLGGNVNNTVLGSQAGAAFTTAQTNVAIGEQALKVHSTGNANTAVGRYAMLSDVDGSSNTAIGTSALVFLASGGNTGNTAIGVNGLSRLTSGNYNTWLGYTDSPSGVLTSGSYNTILGAQVNVGVASLSNNIILADGQGNIRFQDDATSTIISRLAGTGTRMVVTDANGALSTQGIPTGSASGGSAVSYYLNGSVAASVGTYYQMSKIAVIGAGTDFSKAGNGLISQFLTDVADPNRLEIPAGAWNFEIYMSASSSGGTPAFYVELLKYDGTTFTSIASSSAVPEAITSGTLIDLYLTSLAIPQTTLLSTDRLAIRVYIVNSTGGRTITMHTENSHLCEIITNFAGGVSALNGLTANTQYFATGTSGTNFAISSVGDTHTFNLPTASGTNRGALSSADWTTFNGKYTLPSLTSGSVLFSNGTTIAQDNANLFWDDANDRLGIGTATPTNPLEISSSALTDIVKIRATSISGYSSVGFFDNSNAQIGGFGYGNPSAIASLANKVYFYSINKDMIFTTNGGNNIRQTIYQATGNIGINTTSDAGYRLDVNGSVKFGTLGIGTGLVWDNTNNRLGIGTSTPSFALDIRKNVNTNDGFYISNSNSGSSAATTFAFGQSPSSASYNAVYFTNYSSGYGSGLANSNALTSGSGSTGGFSIVVDAQNTHLFFKTNTTPGGSASTKMQMFSSGNVLIQDAGTFTEISSSRLSVNSTTQGFLPPRMTTTQKNAIGTPAAGLMVYDTTLNKLCVYTTAWETITSL